MKKCPECGSELMDNAVECGNCGYPLEDQEEMCTDVTETATIDSGEGDNSTKEEEKSEVPEERTTASDEDEGSSDSNIESEVNNAQQFIKSVKVTDPQEYKTSPQNGSETIKGFRSSNKLKIIFAGIGVLIIALIVALVSIVNLNKRVDASEAQVDILNEENSKLNDELTLAKNDYTKIKDEYEKVETAYTEYQEKMKPYEEMEEAEAKRRKAEAEAEEKKRKAEEEETEKEKQNQEAATEAVKKVWNFEAGTLQGGATKELCADAKTKVNAVTDEETKKSLLEAVEAAEQTIVAQEKAAAEKEARGYETGITYDQLARTPDNYKGEKVKFSGKVIQVIEGDDDTQIRLAVNDDYDTILLGEFEKSIVSSRVLEDDHITIYGLSAGTISYKSTMGGTITIPGVLIEKIDQ